MSGLSKGVSRHYGANIYVGRRKGVKQSMADIGKTPANLADQISSALSGIIMQDY
jgi:phosphosulfolactate phosphohydrolase-like enzyme